MKAKIYKAFEDKVDREEGRARWLSRTTFILAMVGYCVGLGNFWRFPYLCYKWGGAFFFVPYLISLFTIGIPISLMEMSLGQKFQRGDIGVFRGIHPRLAGVGLVSVLASYAIVAYYNVIIAWSLIYLVCSFMSPLPWSVQYATNEAGTHKDCKDFYITEEYFYKDLVKTINPDCSKMDTSSVILDQSVFGWEVYLASIAVWIVVYFCLWKGVNSSSYVVWVTVPMPCFFIVILIMKGLTLDGSDIGMQMYLKGIIDGKAPDLAEKLSNGNMWADACAQIFFSLGICMGTMTSYASFNDVKKPIIGDTFKICLTNSCISFFAGFAVFSVVGYLTEIGSPVSNKVSSIGLAFVAYPAAIEQMPASNLWSLILAITLFSLGIDSAFSMLEACATVLSDTSWGRDMPRKLIALLLCVSGCAFTALFCFNWGFTYFDVVDHYLTVYLMLLVGIFEVFGAGWIYEGAYVIEKFGKAPVLVLFFGYWVSLFVVCILTFVAFPQYNWVGMLIFWACVIISAIISWVMSGQKFGAWYTSIGLYGVRKLARAMTKLSKEPENQHIRVWWEPIFELWWGFMIKYFVPFALFWLLLFSAQTDLTTPYGGYHEFWQWMGFLYPIAALAIFLISVFVCKREEPFEHNVDEAFEEDVKVAPELEMAGTGINNHNQVIPASNKIDDCEKEQTSVL